MAGLQRSQISFRRQGSSGVVWDDKFLRSLQDGEQLQEEQSISNSQQDKVGPEEPHQDDGIDDRHFESSSKLGRSKSEHRYRAVKVADDEEPPSPRVGACGFCGGMFGKKKSAGTNQQQRTAKNGRKV